MYIVFVPYLHDLLNDLIILNEIIRGNLLYRFLCVNVCLYFNVSFCHIVPVLLYKGPRGRQQLLLVLQFSYFNFHINSLCTLTLYIILFFCMKIENKFYSILF